MATIAERMTFVNRFRCANLIALAVNIQPGNLIETCKFILYTVPKSVYRTYPIVIEMASVQVYQMDEIFLIKLALLS